MKCPSTLSWCAIALLLTTTTALAANGPALYAPGILPAPTAQYNPDPYSPNVINPTPIYSVPDMQSFNPPPVHTLRMHHDVKYRQPRKAHPCAVPTIVAVPDPCDPCGNACVGIEICVPPCDQPDIRVRRNGDKVRYDYGKYAVDIVVRKSGLIVVDYDW